MKLAANGTPVLGVCGGYQMLGETLADPEGTESGTAQTVRGLGLLPTRTVFTGQKHRTQDTAAVTAAPVAGELGVGRDRKGQGGEKGAAGQELSHGASQRPAPQHFKPKHRVNGGLTLRFPRCLRRPG